MRKNLLISIFGVLLFSLLAIIGVKTLKQKKHYMKKQQWSELLANHPYNNRPQKSAEEWGKIPKADRPDLAMEQEVLMTMDPALGIVPTERKMLANEKVKTILATKGPIAGITWQERGPNNVGGRTRALMFDPNDSNNKKVWAAGVSGGLWYTNDITAGAPTWNLVDGFWSNIVVSCIAYNPNNTNEFYVGTGEGWFNADAQRGGGIWKTTDGGVTWNQLGSTDPSAYNSGSHFQYVNKIVVKDDGTVFAATRGYYSNTGGIMRSTDGGANWTRVLSQYDGTYYDWGADVEVAANGDLFASMGLASPGQVYKSLDADNGGSGTWTNISSNIAMGNAKRVELACAPSNEDVIYAVAQGGSGDQDVEWIKKSTNGGANWTSLSIPLMADGSGDYYTRGQAFYDLILAVHPTNENLVIAGGIDLHRTTNGGTNWNPISHWYGGFSLPEVHADQHAIHFRPGASDEVIFGNDGGFFYSTNAGDVSATPSFTSKNIGYNVTQFYACAAKNEINSNYFLAGAQDNGSQKFTLPQIGSTTEVTGGDGAFCHIDQLNPDIQMTAYTNNNIYRSLDGGNSFPSLISESSGWFINPSDYDSQRKILYLAAGDDQLKRISGMDGTTTNTNIGISVGTAQVSALKVSPYNDVVFIGIENGRVYKLSNASTGSTSLSRIDNGTTPILTAGYVSCIEVGANDNQLIVTFSNYGVTSIWETTDGGTNWYSKEGNLPDMPVRWALYNPDNRDQVLLATEVGVWSTDNFGTGTSSTPVWGVSSTDLAYTRCTMLKYRAADKMVVVSTHGRGLFTSDIFTGSSVADFVADQYVSCTGSLTVQFTDGSTKPEGSWAWDVDNDGTTDYTTQNPTHTYNSPGLYSVKLTINSGADEIIKDDIILVMVSEPTVSTGCSLSDNSNDSNGFGIGISNFTLNTINNTSSYNDGYYLNYVCTDWTQLELNTTYDVTITTGTANNEGAKVYIDYNDNGTFEESEAVVSFPANKDGTRTLSFTTPASGVIFDDGLRLRVLSKFGSIPSNACDISTYGQAEDYTVYFKSQTPTWTGAISSNWNTSGNWSTGVVPGASDDVVIANAGTAPIIGSGVQADCNNLTVNAGATLTIASGGSLITAGTITRNGTINIEHTMTDGHWHLVSSPVIGATANVFFGDYLQYFDETLASNNYIEIDNETWPLNACQGYAWRNYGKGSFTFSGTPFTGDQSIETTSIQANGWNLIGNPYPSSIDWEILDNTYGTAYTFSDNGVNSGWGQYNNGAVTNNGPRYLAPMQAFFISTSSAGTFAITNAARTHEGATGYVKSVAELHQFVKLQAQANDKTDETFIQMGNGFDEGFDRLYDGWKMAVEDNSYLHLYSKTIDGNLSINRIPATESVQLGLRFAQNTTARINIMETAGFDLIKLEDTKLQTFHNLMEGAYEFDWNATDSEERFILHLKATGVNELNAQEAQVYAWDDQVYIRMNNPEDYNQVQVFDLSGRLIVSSSLTKTEIQSIKIISKGAYLVKLSGESGSLTEKIIIE